MGAESILGQTITRKHNETIAVDQKRFVQRLFNGSMSLAVRISQLFERIKPDQVPEVAAKTRCGGQRALTMQTLDYSMSCLPRADLGRS